MQRDKLEKLLNQAGQCHLICVGDVLLDQFVDGAAEGISREAPVLSFSARAERNMPGGAGNAARNLHSLGARVSLLGVVGDDLAGDKLNLLFADYAKLGTRMITEPGRQTPVKTRYVVGGQQTFSVDQNPHGAISDASARALLDVLTKLLADAQGVVLSDYGRGTLRRDVISAVILAAGHADIPVFVDPRGKDYSRYNGATLIKPNALELQTETGIKVDDDASAETALTALGAIVPETKTLIVTRGGRGMTLLCDGTLSHVRAAPRNVYDVSGAGDTTLAALSLAYASGFSFKEAADFANRAAGVAVSKSGTAIVTPDELLADFHASPVERAPICNAEQASAQLKRWRAEGLHIGMTNGCFDVIHLGHLTALEQARAQCDRLVIALNDDASVQALKGPGRPVNTLGNRMRLMSGLRPVDMVISFSGETAHEAVRIVRPDVYIKGGDYSEDTLPEAALVRELGGRVFIAQSLAGHSTTGILEALGKDLP
jgi:D-beta-D-heptose 7-phosphate kinase/D-beta-D-heptose 1-phosphate adenosyltransferase